jgi:hypothetical protein
MEYKTEEQKIKRFIYLKQELEKVMPSVINAIGFGFYPANYKMLENMAQEYWQLKNELSL